MVGMKNWMYKRKDHAQQLRLSTVPAANRCEWEICWPILFWLTFRSVIYSVCAAVCMQMCRYIMRDNGSKEVVHWRGTSFSAHISSSQVSAYKTTMPVPGLLFWICTEHNGWINIIMYVEYLQSLYTAGTDVDVKCNIHLILIHLTAGQLHCDSFWLIWQTCFPAQIEFNLLHMWPRCLLSGVGCSPELAALWCNDTSGCEKVQRLRKFESRLPIFNIRTGDLHPTGADFDTYLDELRMIRRIKDESKSDDQCDTVHPDSDAAWFNKRLGGMYKAFRSEEWSQCGSALNSFQCPAGGDFSGLKRKDWLYRSL